MAGDPRGEDAERRACPRCGARTTVRDGHVKGRQRWLCRGCGRSFGATTGTAVAGLHTEVGEVARTLHMVLRRGSFRGAEEVTGHKHETISDWLDRAAAHADALSAVLVQDLALSDVEVDEFWSFVQRKKGAIGRTPSRPSANDGGV